jgi:murein endopeptidase
VRPAALLLLILAFAVPGALLLASRDDDPEPPRATPVPTRTVEPTPSASPLPPARAEGAPWDGRLIHGRMLPERGPGYVTWDPILKQVPNRSWRRWGTGRLLRTIERVLAAYARRHPDAPPVLVGDLSRPHGGDFGPRFGGIGHASHQNGLDADVMYPRRDGAQLAARRPSEVDRVLAQDLVDRFRAAGAVKLFVGPHLHLHGPRSIVVPLAHHDDHVHVRIANPRRPARNAP